MKWLSFGHPDGERPGVLVGDDQILDIGSQWPQWPGSWRQLLAAGLENEIARRVDAGSFESQHIQPLSSIRLAPPVPDASKVVALGRNYSAHAAEQNRKASEKPMLFAKAPSSLVGHEATVIVPTHESKPDFEAEMALVIGRTVRSKT